MGMHANGLETNKVATKFALVLILSGARADCVDSQYTREWLLHARVD